MSAIQDKLKALREQEEKLKLEQKKIEFLRHIEASVVNYDLPDFKEVKADVVVLVQTFVADSIKVIEGNPAPQPVPTAETTAQPAPTQAAKPAAAKAEPEMSPGEKMNFALDNRHLAGKQVNVLNDKNIDIRGEVVGLDAPYVLVKTTTGPTIKVPLNNVSLQ